MEKSIYDWSYGRFNKTKYKNTIASSILGIIFTTNCLVVLDGPITRDQLQRSLSPHIMLCSVGDYAHLDTRYPNSTLITNTCWLSGINFVVFETTYILCITADQKKTKKKTDRQTTHYKGTQLSVASLCG